MLIVIDGIYSAGKSSIIASLASRLHEKHGRDVFVSDWNSSELVGELIPRWKRTGRLKAYSLLHAEALDLAYRCETEIEPRLAAGEIVVTDRYAASGMARAVIRGADRALAAAAFGFAPAETCTVLVECDPVTTLERRKALGKVLDGYHSGRDFRRGSSVESDFVDYQRQMAALYRELVASRGACLRVDTTEDVPTLVELRRWRSPTWDASINNFGF